MILHYRPDVLDEVMEVVEHYEEAQSGLGNRFLAALEGLYEKLMVFPASAPESVPPLRFAVMLRVPYVVHYSISGDVLNIYAVVHAARHESVWKRRV